MAEDVFIRHARAVRDPMRAAHRRLPRIVLCTVCLFVAASVTPAIDFETKRSFPVGNSPKLLLSVDLNRDGHSDLISTGTSLVVILGDGRGRFSEPVTYSFQGLARDLASGDLNGDGYEDILVSTITFPRVWVFLGDGTGALEPGVWFPSEVLRNDSLTVADFDGDGSIDVATGNVGTFSFPPSISLFFGDGTGALAQPLSLASSPRVLDIAAADFNNDGMPDLITGDSDRTFSLRLNQGSQEFGDPVSWSIQGIPRRIATKDLNKDGNEDVVVLSTIPDVLQVFIGDGLGGFMESDNFLLEGDGRDLRIGDMNRDGRWDLVVMSLVERRIRVFLGDGAGTFDEGVGIPSPHFPEAIALADFDEDGAMDIAATANRFDSVVIHRGDGNGGSPSPGQFDAGPRPLQAVPGDLNGDLNTDIVVVNEGSENVSILLGDGDGHFQPPLVIAAGLQPRSVLVQDLTGDGRPDLILLGGSRHLSFLRGRGDASFDPPIVIEVGQSPGKAVAADFNEDGTLDLAVIFDHSSSTVLLEGDGSGHFTQAASFFTSSAEAIVSADFNGDGHLDIAVNSFRGGPAVYLGDGDFGFSFHWIRLTFEESGLLAAGDFDEDGDLDLFEFLDSIGDETAILFNDGTGRFDETFKLRQMIDPSDALMGDFNGDGHLDLVASDGDADQLLVYAGDGNGGVSRPFLFFPGLQPNSVAAADFNADGRLDLVTANTEQNSISVLLNVTNRLPVAHAGFDVTLECTGNGGAVLTLDGSGSTDPDSSPGSNDDIVAFEWFEDFGMSSQALLGSGETLVVTLPLGSHTITLRVTDSFGETDTDEVFLTVEDTAPPLITVGVTPDTLWPPNHHMVDVEATVIASDNCGTPTVALTSLTSNEADDAQGKGDGKTTGDIQPGVDDFHFILRAERAGTGSGRIYTAVYTATDGSGNAASDAGFVVVPHDQNGVIDPVEIVLEQRASGTVVSWSEVPDARTYDVIRGELSNIVETGVVIDLGTVVCIEANSTDENTTGQADSELPNPGQAFFYLVEYDDGISSSYGTESAGKPRAPGSGDCQ